MTPTEKRLEYTMYDLRGEWATETNKKEILSQLNTKLKIKIHQALAEEKERVEEMRNAPPPFSADEKNPMKHIYQNQGYVRALDDFLSLDTNKE